MKIDIEIDEAKLTQLVIDYIASTLGSVEFSKEDVKIEVMTKNNYRVKEWENGRFRARIQKNV